MSKTILAVAVVFALAGCGGKEQRAKAGSTARSGQSEASRSTSGTQSTQQKKKATKPDTARAKNPLTNN